MSGSDHLDDQIEVLFPKGKYLIVVSEGALVVGHKPMVSQSATNLLSKSLMASSSAPTSSTPTLVASLSQQYDDQNGYELSMKGVTVGDPTVGPAPFALTNPMNMTIGLMCGVVDREMQSEDVTPDLQLPYYFLPQDCPQLLKETSGSSDMSVSDASWGGDLTCLYVGKTICFPAFNEYVTSRLNAVDRNLGCCCDEQSKNMDGIGQGDSPPYALELFCMEMVWCHENAANSTSEGGEIPMSLALSD